MSDVPTSPDPGKDPGPLHGAAGSADAAVSNDALAKDATSKDADLPFVEDELVEPLEDPGDNNLNEPDTGRPAKTEDAQQKSTSAEPVGDEPAEEDARPPIGARDSQPPPPAVREADEPRPTANEALARARESRVMRVEEGQSLLFAWRGDAQAPEFVPSEEMIARAQAQIQAEQQIEQARTEPDIPPEALPKKSDTLPPPPQRAPSNRILLVVGLIALLLAAAVLVVVVARSRQRDDPPSVEAMPVVEESAGGTRSEGEPEPPPSAESEGVEVLKPLPDEPVEAVSLELEGLPPDATVLLDQEPQKGAVIVQPKSSEEHLLEISAPGFEPLVRRVVFETSQQLPVKLKKSKRKR